MENSPEIAKTDEDLVNLALENQADFIFIINRYKNKLFNYIRRISNVGREEAEDILQDIFIKVYKNLNGFDRDLKFSSWIYRIAHNQVISHYRKETARPGKHSISLDVGEITNLTAEIDMERDLELKIMKRNIEEVLEALPPNYREIIVLKYFEEKSYNEISDILKKPMGTVATLLSKAKNEFKKEVERKNIKL